MDHCTTNFLLGADPIVSYLILPALIARTFLPVPVEVAFNERVIDVGDNAVIVEPVAIPVPVIRSPTVIPAVEPAVTVTTLLPNVIEQVTNCLPNKSAPKAAITLFVVPVLNGAVEVAIVLPSAINPLALMLNVE